MVVTDPTAPGKIRRVCPPTSDSAPSPGAVGPPPHLVPRLRGAAVERAWIRPRWAPLAADQHGYPHAHPYVRRFWIALIGPGAVADLMRLATAAGRGRSLPRPTHLPLLIQAGLVGIDDVAVTIQRSVPALNRDQLRSLHPSLRREHQRAMSLELLVPSAGEFPRPGG